MNMQSSSNKELRKTEKSTNFRSVQYSKIQESEAEIANDSPKQVQFGVNLLLIYVNLFKKNYFVGCCIPLPPYFMLTNLPVHKVTFELSHYSTLLN